MAKVNEQAVIQLIIKGEQSKTTIKEVRTTMIGLERQLLNMKKADDPAGFEKLRKELEKVRAAHSSMITEVRGGEGAFSKMKLSWKEIASGVMLANVAMAAGEKILQSIPALVGKAGELSDSLADVSKQTGITGDDLLQLNEGLGEIDTRTSVEELRKLAVVAGKLGYETREEVLSFVKAADILNVALGEDLGGNVDEALNDIGKLVEIFGLEDEFGIEKSMLKVGSAINTVGASSQANEGYLVNWSKRFAGIAPNAGISIADTLGMAAASDILGQSAEMSAGNIGKMIIALGKDVPYFAKVAKMGVSDFSNLLKTDGNEAFLRVLEGAQSSTKGVEGLAKMLETLGIEGSEGAAVLGAFAKNTQLVREQQDIATASFEKGTSVIEEFNVKNNNSAAILEKIGKVLNGWWERAAAGMNPFIEMFGKWAGVVSEVELQLKEVENQQNKVTQAESKFPALLKRYDDLKSKSKLTKEEQAELQKIVNQITTDMPAAATSFDKYGNALDINRSKVTDWINDQRTLLETMRQTRRELLKEEVQDIDKRAKLLGYELNLKKKYSVNSGGQTITQNLSTEDINAKRKELAKLQADRAAYQADLDGLNGIFKATPDGAGKSPPPKKDPPGGNNNDGLTGPAAKTKYNNDFILKNQQQLTLSMMKEQEKEMQAVQYKYDEMREKAKGHAADIARINEQQVQEVTQINDKYNKKYLGDFDKTMRGQLKLLNEKTKEEQEYLDKKADDRLKRADKELFEINDHYLREIAQAKAKGESIIEIEKLWRAEVDKLNADRGKKETDNFLGGIFDSYRSELALAQENGTSKEEIIQSHLERLRILRETYGALDVEQQKKINQEIARSDRDLMAVRIDNINKTGDTMKMGGQVISDVLGLAAGNQAEYAEFQKALGLFQIAVETGTAVASAVALGTKGDPYTVALRIATAVAAVTGGMLKAKQLMAEAEQPATPAFREHGGFTDLNSIHQDRSGNPEGWVSRPTLFNLGKRSYVAGEGYKKEYVLSNAMLQDPAIADFVGGVEALRQGRFFENGGSTALPPPRSGGSAGNPNAKMERLLEALLAKEGGWNYSVLEKYANDLDNVRKRASV